MGITRRTGLQGTLAGIATLAFDGGITLLTAKQARAEGRPYRVLTNTEVEILEALGNRLAVDAAKEGIAHFIDDQLSKPGTDALLTVRYLDIAPPFSPFYSAGLAALEASSQAAYSRPFIQLSGEEQDSLIVQVATTTPKGWTIPIPAPVFYFALRSDAVDVVYGTVDGFKKLNVPYMAHIVPPRKW